MRNKIRIKIIYGLVSIAILLLPAVIHAEELSYQKEQSLSPEINHELAGIYYDRGRDCYRRENYLKAKTEFEEVLRFDPNHQGALWYLEHLEKRLPKHKKAFGIQLKDEEKRKRLEEKRHKKELKAAAKARKLQARREKARKKRLQKEEENAARKLERYQKSLDEKLQHKKSAVKKIKELDRQKEDVEKELTKGQAAVDLREIRRLEEEKDRLEKELGECLSETYAIRKDKGSDGRKIEQLRDEKARLQMQLEQYARKLERIKKLEDGENGQITQLQGDKKRLEAELRKCLSEIYARNKAGEKEKQHIQELEEEKAQLEARLKEYARRLKQRQPVKISAKEIKQLEQEKKELENQLEEYAETVKESQEEIEQIQQNLEEERTAHLNKVRAEKQKLARELDKLRRNQQNKLEGELNRYEETLRENFARKIDSLNNQLQTYEYIVKQYESKTGQLEQTARELEETRREKQKLQAELSALQRLEKYKEEFRGQLSPPSTPVHEEISVYEEKLARLEKEKERLERLKNDVYKETLELKESEEEKRRLREEMAALRKAQEETLKDQLEQYERTLREKLGQKTTELDDQIEAYESRINSLESSGPVIRERYWTAERPSSSIEKYEDQKSRQEAEPAELPQKTFVDLQKEANRQLYLQLNGLKREQARPFYEKGFAHFKRKKYESAKENLEKALSILPDYTQAENLLKKIEAMERVEIYFSEGEELYKIKEYYKAKAEFEQVLALDYKNRKARKYLRKIERAIEDIERKEVIARQKEKTRLEKEKAELEERRQRIKKEEIARAQEELKRKMVALKKEEERKIEEERQARIQAEREAERSRDRKIKLHLSEAQYYYKKKDYPKAKEEFNQVLALDYKNKHAQDYLHRIEKDIRTQEHKEFLAKQREQRRLEQEKAKLEEKQRRIKEEALARARKEMEREEAARKKAERRRRELVKKNNKKRGKKLAKKQRQEKAAELERRQKEKVRQDRKEVTQLQEEKEESREKELLERKIKLHYLRGKKHFRNRDYIAATKEFKDILILDPKNKYALNALDKVKATMEREINKCKHEKEQRIKAERRKHQEEINQHLAQGKLYFYKENYTAAIDELGKALFIDPQNAVAEKYMSKCRNRLDEAEKRKKEEQTGKLEAKETKETGKTREKQTGEKIGKVRRRVKKKEAKVRVPEKEKAKTKTKAEARREAEEKLREIARMQQKPRTLHSDSKEDIKKLRKIEEFFKKGKYYFRHNLYLEAIACFEEVINLEGNPRIYYTPQARYYIKRAMELLDEEKKEEAVKIAEGELIRKKSEAKQQAEAREMARKQAQRKTEELIIQHYNLGKKYYRQKDYSAAIAEFNKVKEISPGHKYARYAENYIGKCHKKIARAKDTEQKTEKNIRPVAEETEIFGNNLLAQARWYYKKKKYEQAIKICRTILDLDPLNNKARNLLHNAETRKVRWEDIQHIKEKDIDEKVMMSEVDGTHVLPVEERVAVKEKEFVSFLKVPAIREKLKNPISLDFRDVDLSYVLNFLSDSSGVNIIAASGVSLEGKTVTMRMKDIPLENALKYILKNQGLTYRIEEDVVWVASPSEMGNEEVETRVYFLNRGSGMFTEFERTVATGTGLGGSAAISKITTIKDTLEKAVDWPTDSKLVMDERTGALIISNVPSNLQVIEELLYNLDVTPVQVLIEARFIELEVTDVEQLGIEWQLNEAWGEQRKEGSNVTQFNSGSGVDFTDYTRVAEGFNFTYSGVLTYPQFQTTLHALSETQNAKTLSCPRVTTLNNQTAAIKVVDEWIYPTKYEFQVVQSDVNGDGDFDDANETNYQNVPVDFVTKDVGIILHVTPNIGADGKTITLALVPEVSEGTSGAFSYAGSVSLPKFTSRTLSTSVIINNGETVVLGGLVKESTTKTITKVPLLGDIPVLGYLFRKQNDSIVRKNLLIFVTANIISPAGEKVETVLQK